jgi:hypothetical protein
MGAAEKPLAAVALRDEPQSVPRPRDVWGESLKAIVYGDPHFIDPDVNDRLTVLFKMMLAYNNRTSDMDKLDGAPRASRQDHSRRGERATVPTADQVHDWFDRLTSHQRIAISPMFRDRQKYTDMVHEANKLAQEDRANGIRGGRRSARGGGYERMFVAPSDVFVSPRDGKPFVIGYHRVPLSIRDDHGHPHDPRAIAYEQEGVDSLEFKFMEHRRERKCVSMNGQRDTFYTPANAPEVP